MKDFVKKLQPGLLNIEEKNRSNLFAWRGQFSPQLVECLLDAYCLPGSVVLDPFAGSGTVLFEAALRSLPAYGFEINPVPTMGAFVPGVHSHPRPVGLSAAFRLSSIIRDMPQDCKNYFRLFVRKAASMHTRRHCS
jgi:hypothetical protein